MELGFLIQSHIAYISIMSSHLAESSLEFLTQEVGGLDLKQIRKCSDVDTGDG